MLGIEMMIMTKLSTISRDRNGIGNIAIYANALSKGYEAERV